MPERVLKASFNFLQAQRSYLYRQSLDSDCIMTALFGKLVYLNGNNAAKGENNIKYANSYPMNWAVKNWFAQDIFELLW